MPPTKTEKLSMPDRDHLVGCPARRLERYSDTEPKTGAQVVIIRCIDCGGQTVTHDGEPVGQAADEPTDTEE